MATSLASKSIGAPDNAFAWYLQSGGGTLAAGFPVALGNGTETPLWLDEDGIGVRSSGGFVSKIVSAATATRNCSLADGHGVIQPAAQAVLATSVTNSTTTDAAVTGLALALEANSLYEIEAVLLCKSAATTTGVRVSLTGPAAQTEFVSYEMIHATGNTLLTTNTRRQWFSAFSISMDNADAPAADTIFPIYLRGWLKTTGTAPAANLGFLLKSEVAASLVTIAAGSVLRAKRIS